MSRVSINKNDKITISEVMSLFQNTKALDVKVYKFVETPPQKET